MCEVFAGVCARLGVCLAAVRGEGRLLQGAQKASCINKLTLQDCFLPQCLPPKLLIPVLALGRTEGGGKHGKKKRSQGEQKCLV